MKKISKEEFVKRAIEKHGDKFVKYYDECNYYAIGHYIDLYCDIHKIPFKQKACWHIKSAYCCPKCRNEVISQKNQISKPITENKWTFDICLNISLKCESKGELRQKYKGAYQKIIKTEGWRDVMFAHMKDDKLTDDDIKNLALECKSRQEFFNKHYWAYRLAIKRNLLDDVTKHMFKSSTTLFRYVYAYEFKESKTVYVGLTHSLNIRYYQHTTDITSPVYQYINQTNEDYTYYNLGYYTEEDSKIKEVEWFNYYTKKGWKTLNRKSCGYDMGGATKWTKDKCYEVSLLCKNRKEFKIRFRGAESVSRKEGWIYEFFPNKCKGNKVTYTYDVCNEKSKLCRTKLEFREKYKPYYKACLRNKWNDIINNIK